MCIQIRQSHLLFWFLEFYRIQQKLCRYLSNWIFEEFRSKNTRWFCVEISWNYFSDRNSPMHEEFHCRLQKFNWKSCYLVLTAFQLLRTEFCGRQLKFKKILTGILVGKADDFSLNFSVKFVPVTAKRLLKALNSFKKHFKAWLFILKYSMRNNNTIVKCFIKP